MIAAKQLKNCTRNFQSRCKDYWRIKMLLLIDKLKEKLLRLYNPKIFLLKINNKVQNCRVLGKVNCNATNLIIGNNVTIYPNVTFWGDGEIRIGDNVDIGYNTIIFFKKWWCLHW